MSHPRSESLPRRRTPCIRGCGIALAEELVGKRWNALILRELMFGGRGFADLRRGLPGISANLLSQRLRDLRVKGLIDRCRRAGSSRRAWYEASAWGLELLPIFERLDGWGDVAPRCARARSLSSASAMLKLQSSFRPDLAAGFSASVQFAVDGERFAARVDQRILLIRRCDADAPGVAFEGSATEIAALAAGESAVDAVAVKGDPATARRFLRCFRR